MPSFGRRAWFGVLAALTLAASLSACTFTVFASEGDVEPAAEAHYRAVWRENATALAPINASLDVCNIGGTKQACYDASERMIRALSAFLADLRSTKVPSRYGKADVLTRDGLKRLMGGYERRNRGIATNDNSDFLGGNEAIKEANGVLEDAYQQFPPDARP